MTPIFFSVFALICCCFLHTMLKFYSNYQVAPVLMFSAKIWVKNHFSSVTMDECCVCSRKFSTHSRKVTCQSCKLARHMNCITLSRDHKKYIDVIRILGTVSLVILAYFLSIILMKILNLWLLSKRCHLLAKMLNVTCQTNFLCHLNWMTKITPSLVTQTQICITITLWINSHTNITIIWNHLSMKVSKIMGLVKIHSPRVTSIYEAWVRILVILKIILICLITISLLLVWQKPGWRIPIVTCLA